MFGLGRGVTPALVGWLWADLLLGLFAVFLAANSAGVVLPVRVPEAEREQPQASFGIDPQPIELSLSLDGGALLSGDTDAVRREQARVLAQAHQFLLDRAGARRVALVLAFATHEDPAKGRRIARIGTELFRAGMFEGAAVRPYFEIVPDDLGSLLHLEVYLYY